MEIARMKTPTEIKACTIPDYWTPEEALAVYDILSDLSNAVWDAYREALIRSLQQTQGELPCAADLEFDDDIPF